MQQEIWVAAALAGL